MYYRDGIISIYQVIGKKYGSSVQKIASTTFLITRLFADGVRFLATAVVVQAVTGWPIWIAVLLIGLVTTVYTLSGGIRTVLWVDTFQFILYFAGGTIVILFILSLIYRNILVHDSISGVSPITLFKQGIQDRKIW